MLPVPEASVPARVGVNHVRHAVNQTDDQLSHHVPRCRLGGENERPRMDVVAGVVHKPVVQNDDIQDQQQLPLILVQPLDLHIKDRVRGDIDAHLGTDKFRQRDFVGLLHLVERFQKRLVASIFFERVQSVKIHNPFGADRLGDQSRQPWVGLEQPAALRDAVGLV